MFSYLLASGVSWARYLITVLFKCIVNKRLSGKPPDYHLIVPVHSLAVAKRQGEATPDIATAVGSSSLDAQHRLHQHQGGIRVSSYQAYPESVARTMLDARPNVIGQCSLGAILFLSST